MSVSHEKHRSIAGPLNSEIEAEAVVAAPGV